MVSGTAGHNMNLIHRPKLLVTHRKLFDYNILIFQAGHQRICHSLGLFVHLLQHEMLIAGLLRRAGIPVDGHRCFRDLLLVHRIKVHMIRPQTHHFLIVHVVYLSGIL